YTGPGGSAGRLAYMAEQARADAEATRAAEIARRAMGASLEVFTGASNKAAESTKRATAATRAHSSAVDEEAEAIKRAKAEVDRYLERIATAGMSSQEREVLEAHQKAALAIEKGWLG